MIILIILFILSLNIILINILPFIYNDLSIFNPMFLISIIPILKLYIKNNSIYFLILIPMAFIHDLLYSDVFLLTFTPIIMIAFFNYLFYIRKKQNLINTIIITLLSIIFYDSFIFFTLILLYNYNYTILDLLYKISHSFLSNIILIILLYILIKSRKKSYNIHSNLNF